MCRVCDDLRVELRMITDELAKQPCKRKTPVPKRRAYWREYYLKHREKARMDAKERYQKIKAATAP